MVDEVKNPAEAINTDEVTNDRLLKLPSPKISASRTGIASTCMDQAILLNKMCRNKLKENPTNYDCCCMYQCKRYNTLLSFPWKANGMLTSRTTDRAGYCHMPCAQRHLKNGAINLVLFQ